MGLRDREKRALEEIERNLAGEDPRLANRLARMRRGPRLSGRLGIAVGLTVVYLLGLTVVVFGVTTGSAALVVLGAALTAVFPVLLVVDAVRAGRRPDPYTVVDRTPSVG
ncbi:DUF3040 domain-containing protein [Saccharothrix variisporea]|uniref:DUF3040 family protein n=1 Tax=Saccharothrix variisporea TaxID=543527 RepID=A0A495X3M5_9PSEU|nr:DUF3040 domain-containing protein [Saccharothrix variisporea]RKT68550.1 DUF3040 family protein [Saccharothrix variisporea]